MDSSSKLGSKQSSDESQMSTQMTSQSSTQTTSQSETSLCEWRQTSYLKFISTLPRLCSPTICGTTNYKTPKRSEWQSLDTYQPFEWSIEQKALLDPCDFSNAEDLDIFQDIDERIVCKQLDEENDLFFSQNLIIPSPKTPERDLDVRPELSPFVNINERLFDNQWSQTPKTPEYSMISRDSLSIHCKKTPSNSLKLRQKKKLFGEGEGGMGGMGGENHNLMESIDNRSPKDSAFETIDSQNLLSPIYSPDWRNTSLSKRITHLSPICSRNQNHIDLDFGLDFEDNCLNDESMRTECYSQLTCDMLSIESQAECRSQCSPNPLNPNDNVLREYNRCQQQRVFQRFMTKTSTPSHL